MEFAQQEACEPESVIMMIEQCLGQKTCLSESKMELSSLTALVQTIVGELKVDIENIKASQQNLMEINDVTALDIKEPKLSGVQVYNNLKASVKTKIEKAITGLSQSSMPEKVMNSKFEVHKH